MSMRYFTAVERGTIKRVCVNPQHVVALVPGEAQVPERRQGSTVVDRVARPAVVMALSNGGKLVIVGRGDGTTPHSNADDLLSFIGGQLA